MIVLGVIFTSLLLCLGAATAITLGADAAHEFARWRRDRKRRLARLPIPRCRVVRTFQSIR